jgi:hypothetical protein
MTKFEIEVSDILLSVLITEAKQHGRTVPEEAVALLEEYLGTPEEIRVLSNDLQALKAEFSQVKEETSDFAAEVTRRVNLLFHLDK